MKTKIILYLILFVYRKINTYIKMNEGLPGEGGTTPHHLMAHQLDDPKTEIQRNNRTDPTI